MSWITTMKSNIKNQSLYQKQQHPESVSWSPNSSRISPGTFFQPSFNRYIPLKYGFDTFIIPQTRPPEALISIIHLACISSLLYNPHTW